MKILSILFTLLLSCSLYAGNLKIGATAIPHGEILEFVKPILKKQGVNLTIVDFQDYVLPNMALASKDIDANFYQHIVYLENQIKRHGYKFINAGSVHIEPMGIYSKKYKSINEVKEGSTVLFSNSVADRGRVLKLLEKAGLITLSAGKNYVDVDFKDITNNPKKLTFKNDIDAGMLPRAYQNNEADLIVINTNYALEARLNPIKDAISIEDNKSPYVNIVAIREDEQENPDIKILMSVLHSKDVKDFILNKYKGAVIPVE